MDWLFVPFEVAFVQRALWGGLLVSCVCALAGTWVVVRGMAFLGDAMAHGMLPGVAVAALLGGNLILGAAISCAAMAFGVSVLARSKRIAPDTGIGLLFVGMLAAGVIIVSRSQSFAVDLTGFLFGDVLAVRPRDLAYLAVALVIALVVTVLGHRAFVASTFDPRKAHTLGLSPKVAQVALVGLVTLAIVASFHVVGTLLVFGLLIAPPAAALYWSDRIPVVMAVAALIGGLSTAVGLLISWHAQTAAGATIAAVAVASFFLSAAVSALRDRFGSRRAGAAAVAALAVLPLAGCGSGEEPAVVAETPHGFVEGAEEMSEAQTRLIVTDVRTGETRVVDLLSEEVTPIPAGSVVAQSGSDTVPTRLAGDGRFGFLSSGGRYTIVDGGAWTVDHGDHRHYYSAPIRAVGGDSAGPSEGSSGAAGGSPGSVGSSGAEGRSPDSEGSTGAAEEAPGSVRPSGAAERPSAESPDAAEGSPGSGDRGGVWVSAHSDAVLTVAVSAAGESSVFDRAALGAGTVATPRRIEGIAVPYAERLVVVDRAGQVTTRERDGSAAQTQPVTCADPRGQAVTRRGVVFGCADGALVVAQRDGAFVAEKIPYPAPPADRATAFTHRPGSTTLTALAGRHGVWTLDIRAKTWTLTPVADAVAVNTAGEGASLLVLTRDGVLRGLDPVTGAETARLALLAGPADEHATIHVDPDRAYVNDARARTVHEIAYNDNLRVARTFPLDIDPTLMVETGL
ncbi:zinc ABC transporter permease AztB [Nocardia asteroides]|uniref:ABC transporter permease protein n=1 Tax=Nocardia asteroides NBRC 15531 TaxID=1110697 RepID=U5EM39_NOCAS|nr:zinc ABC transporter permease AztB [Nocardia asteroides]UGT46908.1 metal ABC transporter permease [Nocardia asteroides]GAD87393.1 putative ABC transporter permease protein [Nocardia asteroides NBRC 15531]SFM85032.1 ABC-type Mn2+/Zn2+ transport system, permease component [Nocardia asteroides]VEG34231.1 Manganese transport system membrane protein mntB [Nocardia asteroides]